MTAVGPWSPKMCSFGLKGTADPLLCQDPRTVLPSYASLMDTETSNDFSDNDVMTSNRLYSLYLLRGDTGPEKGKPAVKQEPAVKRKDAVNGSLHNGLEDALFEGMPFFELKAKDVGPCAYCNMWSPVRFMSYCGKFPFCSVYCTKKFAVYKREVGELSEAPPTQHDINGKMKVPTLFEDNKPKPLFPSNHQVTPPKVPAAPPPKVHKPNCQPNATPPFDWSAYLEQEHSEAAPIRCFKHAPLNNEWKSSLLGAMLEVQTRDGGDTSDTFWVARIIQIAGYRARLRFEGYGIDSSRDFWIHLCTTESFPINGAVRVGKNLKPPKEVMERLGDSWLEHISKVAHAGSLTISVPIDKVKQGLSCPFKKGMRLEAVYKRQLSHTCVARVINVVADRIHVQYENCKDPNKDFWFHHSSPWIHPVGWSQRVGHRIIASAAFKSEALDKGRHKKSGPEDAPWEIFKMHAAVENHGFAKGMKMEVVDPLKLGNICAATVMEVLEEGYLMIAIDGCMEDKYSWFCYHVTSPLLLPVGFCEHHQIPIVPPRGFEAKFDWVDYLKETQSIAAPVELFNQDIKDRGFRPGQKIEAVDLIEPGLICVASVVKTAGPLISVHFDGWESSFDQWVDSETSNIYPVGWCEMVGYPLQAPKMQEHLLTSNLGSSEKSFKKHSRHSSSVKKRKLEAGGKLSAAGLQCSKPMGSKKIKDKLAAAKKKITPDFYWKQTGEDRVPSLDELEKVRKRKTTGGKDLAKVQTLMASYECSRKEFPVTVVPIMTSKERKKRLKKSKKEKRERRREKKKKDKKKAKEKRKKNKHKQQSNGLGKVNAPARLTLCHKSSGHGHKRLIKDSQERIVAHSSEDNIDVVSTDRPVDLVSMPKPIRLVSSDRPVKMISKDRSIKLISKERHNKLISHSRPIKVVSSGDRYVKVITKPEKPVKVVSTPDRYVKVVSSPEKSVKVVSTTPDRFVKVVSSPEKSVKVVTMPDKFVKVVSSPEKLVKVVSSPNKTAKMVTTPVRTNAAASSERSIKAEIPDKAVKIVHTPVRPSKVSPEKPVIRSGPVTPKVEKVSPPRTETVALKSGNGLPKTETAKLPTPKEPRVSNVYFVSESRPSRPKFESMFGDRQGFVFGKKKKVCAVKEKKVKELVDFGEHDPYSFEAEFPSEEKKEPVRKEKSKTKTLSDSIGDITKQNDKYPESIRCSPPDGDIKGATTVPVSTASSVLDSPISLSSTQSTSSTGNIPASSTAQLSPPMQKTDLNSLPTPTSSAEDVMMDDGQQEPQQLAPTQEKSSAPTQEQTFDDVDDLMDIIEHDLAASFASTPSQSVSSLELPKEIPMKSTATESERDDADQKLEEILRAIRERSVQSESINKTEVTAPLRKKPRSRSKSAADKSAAPNRKNVKARKSQLASLLQRPGQINMAGGDAPFYMEGNFPVGVVSPPGLPMGGTVPTLPIHQPENLDASKKTSLLVEMLNTIPNHQKDPSKMVPLQANKSAPVVRMPPTQTNQLKRPNNLEFSQGSMSPPSYPAMSPSNQASVLMELVRPPATPPSPASSPQYQSSRLPVSRSYPTAMPLEQLIQRPPVPAVAASNQRRSPWMGQEQLISPGAPAAATTNSLLLSQQQVPSPQSLSPQVVNPQVLSPQMLSPQITPSNVPFRFPVRFPSASPTPQRLPPMQSLLRGLQSSLPKSPPSPVVGPLSPKMALPSSPYQLPFQQTSPGIPSPGVPSPGVPSPTERPNPPKYHASCKDSTKLTNPWHWTTQEVMQFLYDSGEAGCAETVFRQQINGQKLMSLNKEQIAKLTGMKVASSIKIYQQLTKLRLMFPSP